MVGENRTLNARGNTHKLAMSATDYIHSLKKGKNIYFLLFYTRSLSIIKHIYYSQYKKKKTN